MIKYIFILFISFFLTANCLANPQGGIVTSGSATIVDAAGYTRINQGTKNAIINWSSFNINANEKTAFFQPPGGITLNRINHNLGASQIFGQLTATGQIILINQSGIYFGPSARVNVRGIIASTSDITDRNFQKGNYIFDQPSLYQGAVVNQGIIHARNNGLVALIGAGVANDGTINARLGNVVLASGDKFTLSFSGDQLINFTVDASTNHAAVDSNGNKLKNGVSNRGTIIADGGTIRMTARSARNVLDHAINMEGVAVAHSVYKKNGVIILDGGEGVVQVAGNINTSGKKGGTVKVLGNDIKIAGTAVIKANGHRGGGKILIGGNYQGKGPEYNAKTTTVANGAQIIADATQNGDGGTIIIWSDDNTTVHGNLSVQGGPVGGNGGFIETSGKYLDINDATFNLAAKKGKPGSLLLDPANISISNGVNNNIDCITTPGLCLPTTGATTSTINATGLMTALGSGNVFIDAMSSGGALGSISVNAGLTWNAATTLTLYAYNNINVSAAITATNGELVLRGENQINVNAPINVYGMTVTGPGGGPIAHLNNTVTIGAGNLTLDNVFASTASGDITGTGGVNIMGQIAYTVIPKTYTGGTTISTGNFLQVSSASGFSNSRFLDNDGFLFLQGNQSIPRLSGSGSGFLQSTGTVTVNNNANTSYAGILTGAALNLVKSGSGTLTLSGPNDYGGTTTVNGGTLRINAANALTGADVTLQSGGLAIGTSGPSSIPNNITMSGNSSISADKAITLSGTLSGGGSLSLQGAGSIRFDSPLPSMSSLSSSVNTIFNNGGITTVGDQAYSSGLNAASPTTLTLTGSDSTITFGGVISGGNNLTLKGNNSNLNFVTYPKAINITLTDPMNINKGTISSEGTTIVSEFTGMLRGFGNPAFTNSITVPESKVSSIVFTSATSGYVGDPFFFNDISPTQASFIPPVSAIPGSLVTVNGELIISQILNEDISDENIINTNIETIISDQLVIDEALSKSLTVCY